MLEFLEAFFITPWVEMAQKPIFFFQVMLRGLLSGAMYSLVALGFALILDFLFLPALLMTISQISEKFSKGESHVDPVSVPAE